MDHLKRDDLYNSIFKERVNINSRTILQFVFCCRIFCPEDGHTSTVSLWTIMSKVRLEAFMWVSCAFTHEKFHK